VNTAKSRYFDLVLGAGQPFMVIGVDGGLTEYSVQRERLVLAPGERIDVLVAPRAEPGTPLVLRAVPFNRGFGSVEFRSVEDLMTLTPAALPPVDAAPLPQVHRVIAPMNGNGAKPIGLNLVLNKGEDPDTFIRRNGAEAYRERLRTSRPYLEYLLDQAAAGVDFAHDEARRQFLGRMLEVAARIPEATARDQFADRIAHKARVTEDVVRAEIRKAAVHKKTTLTTRELPAVGQMKPAEKGLLWALVHNSRQGLSALDELDTDDLAQLATRPIFELARSLQETTAPEGLPTALLQRLSTEDARTFASVAAIDSAPALSPVECARTIKKLRWQRERAAIQREIDRLQELGSGAHSSEIDVLLRKKNDLGLRIEQLT